MTDSSKVTRLSKIAREFNVGISTIVEFLHKKGITIDANPNTKITSDLYAMLLKEYSTDIRVKEESAKLELGIHRGKQESVSIDAEFKDSEDDQDNEPDEVLLKDLSSHKPIEKEHKPIHKPAPKEEPIEKIETVVDEVKVKVIGKIDLEPKKTKPVVHPSKIEKIKEAEPKKTESVHKHEPKKERPVPVEEKPVVPEDKAETATASQKEEIGEIKTQVEQLEDVKVVGRIDLALLNQKTRPAKKSKEEKAKERRDREVVRKPSDETTEEAPSTSQHEDSNFIQRKVERLSGPTVIGKIELPTEPRKDKPGAPLSEEDRKKKKRKRIRKDKVEVAQEQTGAGQDPNKKLKQAVPQSQQQQQQKKGGKKRLIKKEVNEEDVQKQIKDTLARLTATKGKSKGSKHRRDKRELYSHKAQEEMAKMEAEKNILKVTEFVSVNELANMMDVAVTEVIGTCMNLGLFVSINQRLDAETMSLVADEFGYKVEFVSAELLESIAEEVEDSEEDLVPRPPIITVMGHVDHGKTSLLDYIRKANVIAGEAGGITQHIGAYTVSFPKGKITFLDTPGHEAFTAMRARGASVTDLVVLVVAADDGMMPQTLESIDHAKAAEVPLVVAVNKIDKPEADLDRVKRQLSERGLSPEEWGGDTLYCPVSAKKKQGISELLEAILLQSEVLELKADVNAMAEGTVIESRLDRNRGPICTILVQKGILKVGDAVVAGTTFGRVRAMMDDKGVAVDSAHPSYAVQVMGITEVPHASDIFNVVEDERVAKDIAENRADQKRKLAQAQNSKISLEDFFAKSQGQEIKELSIVVKTDVHGSLEAVTESLNKIVSEKVKVKVVHSAVGGISESDVLLASASHAIIIGFNVRPETMALNVAKSEGVDIKLYKIIYEMVNDVKLAMQGLLAPTKKEKYLGRTEVRQVFSISKVGSVAGCYVVDGNIARSAHLRLLRDNVVIYEGKVSSLKRFKDDVKEVAQGFECGMNIEGYNDVKTGDVIEAFEIELIQTSL
ncbi:MAG TPA: translation initiation factor IF-2 [Marinilabiliales bacterium]|nr:translation initiation factor IF-2 [Marinilabiliales bacterium]